MWWSLVALGILMSLVLGLMFGWSWLNRGIWR